LIWNAAAPLWPLVEGNLARMQRACVEMDGEPGSRQLTDSAEAPAFSPP